MSFHMNYQKSFRIKKSQKARLKENKTESTFQNPSWKIQSLQAAAIGKWLFPLPQA